VVSLALKKKHLSLLKRILATLKANIFISIYLNKKILVVQLFEFFQKSRAKSESVSVHFCVKVEGDQTGFKGLPQESALFLLGPLDTFLKL